MAAVKVLVTGGAGFIGSNLVTVDDVVKANLAAMRAPTVLAAGSIFNIAYGGSQFVRAARIRRATDWRDRAEVHTESGLVRQMSPRALQVLGFEASLLFLSERRATQTGDRWGSGKARIERVELIDKFGKQVIRVGSGEPITVRLWWATSEPVATPVFTDSVQTLQGVVVSGPTTRESGEVPEKIDGSGWVDLKMDQFPLLPGTYDITASLTDSTLAHPYDVRRNVLPIDVDRKGPVEPSGIVSFGDIWAFGP